MSVRTVSDDPLRARRWGRRRAIRLAARVGVDPYTVGVILQRAGIWRWQVCWWIAIDPIELHDRRERELDGPRKEAC